MIPSASYLIKSQHYPLKLFMTNTKARLIINFMYYNNVTTKYYSFSVNRNYYAETTSYMYLEVLKADLT